MIRMLQDLTGLDPVKDIPLDSKEVMSLFQNTEALGVTPEDLGGCKLGALGIPEFGTDFAMQMLIDAKPKYFSDLVRISGLSHGTDVWLGNAKDLILSGQATIQTAICCRDDIMIYLIQKGLEEGLSFTIMESVRKGKGLSLEQVSSLTTISKSMLSQLERGEVNPTISTVYKLALGLKVPVTAFTADKPQPFFGTGKKEVDPLAGDDGRYRLYPIFSFREGQDFEIFDLEFDEGGMMQANRQMNGTREFITVYSGELTLIFKDHEYVLKAGDAASYNAFDDYVYKNTGKGMVTANIVVHYSN